MVIGKVHPLGVALSGVKRWHWWTVAAIGSAACGVYLLVTAVDIGGINCGSIIDPAPKPPPGARACDLVHDRVEGPAILGFITAGVCAVYGWISAKRT